MYNAIIILFIISQIRRVTIYMARKINTVEINCNKLDSSRMKSNKLKSNTKYQYEPHTHTHYVALLSYC